MGRRNSPLPSSGEDCLADNEWGAHGFSSERADAWMGYGFYTPSVAQEWEAVVGSPEEAAEFVQLGADSLTAYQWRNFVERSAQHFQLEHAFKSVNGNFLLASSYDRHFHWEDWGYLFDAGVNERASAHVFQLMSAIESRNSSNGVNQERVETIYEAVNWLGSDTRYSLTRISLLQNLIYSGMEPHDVRFILMDKEGAVSAEAAIRANKLVEEAKFEYNAEGVAAYRLLSQALEEDVQELADLIKSYGVQKVVSALETGLTTPAQLGYYLQHGGVVEISRGAL